MRQLLRRLFFYLLAFWASLTLNFFIPRLAPGNPAGAMLARFQGRLPPEAVNALLLQFGVTNEPLWMQYIHYLNSLLHGDLGLSITYYPTPVSAMLAQELPWTIALVGTSVLISFAVGTLIGIIIAWKRGSWLDTILPPIMNFLAAIPYFWLALLTLYILAYTMNWFPISGGYSLGMLPEFSFDFISDAISHGILPALTIVVSSVSGWMLGMRNAMITTLSEDYVLMAQAKGLTPRRVMVAYAARNAILPNLTGFALSLGSVVGGALLTEMVFSYPGIGFALLQAVHNSDYPLLQAIFLLITLTVLVANLLVDLIYLVLDPRTRQG
ncbi:peptide/nickel transport system permease protein [Thermosporothrix hazakensis]|uniref:Peptide/nickel transport system permease protein n=2 Tax=Thermosporothrix TaxID=768650 RepID=A0A326U7C3_THEHA|nr:ABC transporter permease [Thermosporothrix hazakensis]PZW29432.1 peptide/nickel transport system permease protein [Thermosporothrix hazakensis]